MNSSDDGGYVHDPAAVDADADADGEQGSRGSVGETDHSEPAHPATADREFDWRGWILVGVLCFAFLVAPAVIFLVPPGGEGYRFALLILPLLPAVLLAVTAVWATTRP